MHRQVFHSELLQKNRQDQIKLTNWGDNRTSQNNVSFECQVRGSMDVQVGNGRAHDFFFLKVGTEKVNLDWNKRGGTGGCHKIAT